MELRLRARADRDIEAIAQTYRERGAELGIAFVGDLRQTFERIEQFPLSFTRMAEGVRRAHLERFPYFVYFEVLPERVEVFTVIHDHQRPDLWRERL